MTFGSGFSTAASQSLKSNRSLRREKGTYFKRHHKKAQDYVIPKSSRDSLSSKREIELKYLKKLWKSYTIVAVMTLILMYVLIKLL